MVERRVNDELVWLREDFHKVSLALQYSNLIGSRYRAAIQELHRTYHTDQSLWFEKCNKNPCKNII